MAKLVKQTPGVSLYAKHAKVYPQKIYGTFRRLKWLSLGTLLGIYYLVPWLRWDRGEHAPDQAILLDMVARRGYFFDIEIWAQEVYYLTGILIIGAIGLFLATTLAGRVWCGFTCPQTVWTDLFLWVERLIEGDRNKRIRTDNGPMTASKAARKVVKHTLWIVVSLLTGGAWVFYFTDAPSAVLRIFTGTASSELYGFIALFSSTTYVLAGWAREQVCIYMCPWPRFQGAMLDEDSLLVTYESWRGEPRGNPKKADVGQQMGDCVDCRLCVHVCPTGTDIRLGQQFSCIGCGLCIDACNSVMKKTGRPGNLIAYDSIANQNARSVGETQAVNLLRPRVLVYIAILLAVGAVMAFSLLTRERLEINIQRDRSPLFVSLSSGDIRNGYTFKILNMEPVAHAYTLKVAGLDDAIMTVIGIEEHGASEVRLNVPQDSVGTFRVFVRAHHETLEPGSNPMQFSLTNMETGVETVQKTVFYGPGKK